MPPYYCYFYPDNFVGYKFIIANTEGELREFRQIMAKNKTFYTISKTNVEEIQEATNLYGDGI